MTDEEVLKQLLEENRLLQEKMKLLQEQSSRPASPAGYGASPSAREEADKRYMESILAKPELTRAEVEFLRANVVAALKSGIFGG